MPKPFIPRPISHVSFLDAKVDILIPFHGQYELTLELVESILRLTKSPKFNILLIDDASPNQNFYKKIELYPKTKAIRNETQLGFGGSLKVGFEQTENPWVVIMHSDCSIEQPNWLLNLGQSLQRLKSSNVKMIAPKTNNPLDGSPLLKGNKDVLTEDMILEDGFLSLYCALCHRDLFTHIKGFIKNYEIRGYEDEELSYRMKKYKYKQAVCGSSWVKHYGSKTLDELSRKMDLAKIFEENKKRCIHDMSRT